MFGEKNLMRVVQDLMVILVTHKEPGNEQILGETLDPYT